MADTDRRTKIEFADSMKYLAERYPDASVIRVALDNLNTRKVTSLYEAFPAEQAHITGTETEVLLYPKHGSGLNSAEIELAVYRTAVCRNIFQTEICYVVKMKLMSLSVT